MRWYHWFLVPFVVGLAAVAFVLGNRNMDLGSSISLEIDALEARAVARRVRATRNAAAAAAAIERRYAEKMERLDDDARAVADTLRGDPVRLADWLARIRV